MSNNPATTLTPAEISDLRCVAAMMIPSSTVYDVPGADDDTIFADILASLGSAQRDAAAVEFRATGGPLVAAISRVILQCYYRDDRVVRSLGLEPRPPFPKGHTLEQGDWSLLDPVRARPKLWRDAS